MNTRMQTFPYVELTLQQSTLSLPHKLDDTSYISGTTTTGSTVSAFFAVKLLMSVEALAQKSSPNTTILQQLLNFSSPIIHT